MCVLKKMWVLVKKRYFAENLDGGHIYNSRVAHSPFHVNLDIENHLGCLVNINNTGVKKRVRPWLPSAMFYFS